ncbi:kama family protein [Patellaria atrata CBS 101060]|uniref:Kama family protein n=1 Tax=Patellaria atrata CBS 101060 TaxID=1346257 RepID=A0A9P4VRI7_9PEZI|nr:kama family protein [Patellaria atrata CBS 101060]
MESKAFGELKPSGRLRMFNEETRLREEKKALEERRIKLLLDQHRADCKAQTGDPFWQEISKWEKVTQGDFLSHKWQVANAVYELQNIVKFLDSVLPPKVPGPRISTQPTTWISKRDFIDDVEKGMLQTTMAVKLTPYILSRINWKDPVADPIRVQFLPLRSAMSLDHPMVELDSLHERNDMPVPGLVHRYPDRVLFLATHICPLFCRFCTRAYAIGPRTEWFMRQAEAEAMKDNSATGSKRWAAMYDYIEKTPAVNDVVVSGGDAYMLASKQIKSIGESLLSIPHVKRIRFATKGLSVGPMRFLDPDDDWTNNLLGLNNLAREVGKEVYVHTHFNHPNEISWITQQAMRRLHRKGLRVRNQAVMLKDVNNSVPVMSDLIRKLSDIHIDPYYVYIPDMTPAIEDLRVPLHEFIAIEKAIIGSIGGFKMPKFVVDAPGGGGKRPAMSYESYDRTTGISTWTAPGAMPEGKKDKVFTYYDPLWLQRTPPQTNL